VNDAAVPLGSNRDRHERVGLGQIGKGLATFLGHPAFQGLPAVTETWKDEGRETKDIKTLRRLARKGQKEWTSRS
jgi:deoxyribonuclease-4